MDIQNVIEILSNFDMQVSAKADGAYQSTTGEKACKYAVAALEELAQYRQIGTVKDVKNGMEELSRWHTSRINKKIKNPFAYTSTVGCFNCNHKDEYIEDLEYTVKQYEQIGTEEECRTAREKMKPKKVVEDTSETAMYCRVYICPSCGKKFTGGSISNNCYHCGQALDWTESEEK